MADWLQPHWASLREAGTRALELGCGPGEDAAKLAEQFERVVACDVDTRALAQTRGRIGTGTLLRVDHSRPLPFVGGAFDVVVASLTLHYMPWAETVAAFEEIRRVLRPGCVLLFRVNATDDVHFGALDGTEVERNYRRYGPGEMSRAFKRFFDEAAVRDAVGDRFTIDQLRHMSIDLYERPKRVWECLALART